MARYVIVTADGFSKAIVEGPFELEDPALAVVEEGQRLMPEDEALNAGYRYAADGA